MFKISRLIKDSLSCQRRLASSFLFSLVFLSGLSASAQTTTTSFVITDLAPNTVSCTDTSTPLTFNVTPTVTFTSVGQNVYVSVYAATPLPGPPQTCPAQPVVSQRIGGIATYTSTGSGSLPFTLTQANFGSPLASSVCSVSTTPVALCAYISDSSTGTPALTTGGASTPAVFSSVNTADPEIFVEDPQPGDTQISFKVTTNQNENNGFEVCYATGDTTPVALGDLVNTSGDCTGTGLAAASVSGNISGSSTQNASGTLTWTGLSNNIQYVFIVRGKVGNIWSAVQGPVTPVIGYSTLQLYQGSGGGVSWECAQNNAPLTITSVAMLVALFAIAFFLSPSRRRRSGKLLGRTFVVVLLGLAAQHSYADAGQWDLGLGATFYKPAFDKGTVYPVYKCLYGDAIVPKLGLDADWHVFDPFGSFQLGFELAFTWANGKAATGDHVGETTCATTTLSNTNVNMNLLMFNPRIRYVFDEFVEDFYIVPFVEGGINMTGYYFTYQGSADKKGQPNDHDPLGIRFGWHAGGGFLFLLDWIEPTVSASARANGTYEHIYLKTQVSYVQVNDFGSPGYDFSPAQFGSDIPLQLDFAIVFEF